MTDVLIYLFDHYRAAEAASQRQGDQSGAFIVNLRRFATAPDLISESLIGCQLSVGKKGRILRRELSLVVFLRHLSRGPWPVTPSA